MTAKLLKQQYLKKAILKQLYYEGALSLADICVHTNKSLPVVSSTIMALLEEGYIQEYGLAPSTGGRRPITYLLNNKKQTYIVVAAVDQLEVRIGIYSLINEPIIPVKSFSLDLVNSKHAIDDLVGFLRQAIASAQLPEAEILGVGIAIPGVYNVKEGVNHTFFADKANLPAYLSEILALPVYIDNDSRAIAMAELKFGAAKGYKDVMVVNIGWGIGLGMIVDGMLFSGHNGYAGEFSHIPLANSNNLCSCGKRGCLEVDASLLVLVEKAKREMSFGVKSKLEHLFKDESALAGEQLLAAARSGDPLAISLLAEGGFMIGKGLATLIHVMNPESIVLSGRGASAGKIWLASIHQAINEFCIPRLAEQTLITVSNIPQEAQLLGAATVVVENTNFGYA